MVQNRYRIGEYQISEFPDGRIWWTSHSGFAIQVGGPCYVLGNVLLIGDRCSQEIGFMKSEFLDYLKKLPLWNKTRYYCFSSSLMDTATGKHPCPERLQQLGRPHDAICSNTIMAGKSETYRMGRYQIAITSEGDITWKSYAGMYQIVQGSALIESNILFIGPKRGDPLEKSKREFLRTLQSRPKWNGTAFWCQGQALKPVIVDRKDSKYVPVAVSTQIIKKAERHFINRQKNLTKQIWSSVTAHCTKLTTVIRTKWIEKKKTFWD